MATDWVPAVTAGIRAIAAIGGQAVGALFQGHNQERSEQRQRREQAIEVLAQVKALLIDANPQRLAYNASEETFTETFSASRERWQQVRIPLPKLGVGHPAGRIRGMADELATALSNSLVSANLLVVRLLNSKDSETLHATAKADYDRASELAKDLMDAVRGTEPR